MKIGHLQTFSARSTDSYAVPRLEESCLGDGIVNFSLEDIKEAVSANLLTRFRALQHGFVCLAESAVPRSHSR